MKMSYYPNDVPEGEPTIQTLENENKFVEWNIIAENHIDEGVLINLSEKLSVNGITARCTKIKPDELVCRYEFSSGLLHEIYWDTAMRNLLVIEREIGNLISIEKRPRKYWKLRFVINERVGGFNIDKTDLMVAVENQDVNKVKKIVKNSTIKEINAETPLRNTALNYAIYTGNVEIIEKLLNAGANINVSGEVTPLQYAAYENVEILKMIISRGGKINLVNKYGETALMTAAGCGKSEIVSWLLENGADKHLKDVFGKNASDKAESNKHYDVVKMLN
jgi:uncharacterized protein